MSSYNDLSSDDEDESLSNSKPSVVLGFVDAPITENDKPTFEDTFLGSVPVWLDENSPPSLELLCCKSCGGSMALLLQAFSPMENTFYDRVIYIFACKKPSCKRRKGSIRAIRSIRKDPIKMKELEEQTLESDLKNKLELDNQKKLEVDFTKDLFKQGNSQNQNPFASSNPFENNPFSSKTETEKPEKSQKKEVSKPTFADIASTKNIKDVKKKSNKTSKSITLEEYPGSFLYVAPEKFKKTNQDQNEMKQKLDELDNSVLDTEFEVGSSSDNTGDSKLGDRQESQRIVSMLDDPVFQNLTQLISHNPSQVLRYDLGGKPLLYSGKDDIYKIFNNKDGEFKIPIPGYNPSSTRQFELQLMPQAILDLEKDNIDIINGMEWGTIIVCTDVEDYMPHLDENHVGYIEEWCGVQWEESV